MFELEIEFREWAADQASSVPLILEVRVTEHYGAEYNVKEID